MRSLLWSRSMLAWALPVEGSAQREWDSAQLGCDLTPCMRPVTLQVYKRRCLWATKRARVKTNLTNIAPGHDLLAMLGPPSGTVTIE